MADQQSPNSAPPRIALVGHCGPDRWALQSAVGTALPSAEIVALNNESELTKQLPTLNLVLVNRVLDGRFQNESGIELIARLRKEGAKNALLLISNFPEAQQEAEAVGANPGFGKSESNSQKAQERMRAALAARR